MKKTSLFVSAALAGLLASSGAMANDDHAAAANEKCYGIAKAGKNDCKSVTHSCAGQAKTDHDANEFVNVAHGECEKQGGKLSAGEAK